MGLRYFKRFRMELKLAGLRHKVPDLPEGYTWSAWKPEDVMRHANAKFSSFRGEVDTVVFPCLGNLTGCRRLMKEIAGRASFLPSATWLISYHAANGEPEEDCATIQGLAQHGGTGAIQNVGVVPRHRGFGLGRALVMKSIEGFQQARMRRVFLEVTAENSPAVDLYRSIGFQLTRTLYKATEAEPTSV